LRARCGGAGSAVDVNWDCEAAAAPSGCTSSNPTISRYQVYCYEIANGYIDDWSGNGLADNSAPIVLWGAHGNEQLQQQPSQRAVALGVSDLRQEHIQALR
jgi:hypothetical protein